MTADVPILVIGGGIGGMTAALALARAGFTAHIVERSPQFGEIGAGIQLAPNALRVLDGLGVLPELTAPAVRLRHLVLMHADTGEHLTTVDFGEPFERRYGYAYAVMHRGDLLAVLAEACRAEERITSETSREVTELSDDGLWSAARTLVSDDRPVCQRFVAYRGALPVRDVTGRDVTGRDVRGRRPGRAGRRDHLDRARQAPGAVPDPPRRAVQPGRRVLQPELLS